MRYAVVTDIGYRYKVNEDSYFVPDFQKSLNKENPLFIICDGVGGHNSGEIASKFVVDFLSHEIYTELEQKNLNHNNFSVRMSQYIKDANRKLLQLSYSKKSYSNMSSTLVSAYFSNENIFIHSVGDSRIYRFENNQLNQLNEEHSLVWELYKAGVIEKDEMRRHPKKNIVRMVIGYEERVEINSYSIELEKNDIFLLCSDGLTDLVSEKIIEDVLQMKISIDEKIELLKTKALSAGGKDNITIIIIEV
ncbi:MAG: protein phosphatase 2C domain-containing protein [Candidatus Cloacimonadota bacterium]|nr:protein phosphatase 2C domain-containing protein [Candidatus Cloacimonadota bacterium]